jgi:hypothetical protein
LRVQDHMNEISHGLFPNQSQIVKTNAVFCYWLSASKDYLSIVDITESGTSCPSGKV